jgi:hypothetical protein
MTALKGGETAVASRFGRQAAEIGRAAMGLANEDRTRALLARAGFADVRTEEAPVRFIYRDVDDYERWVIDVAGPFAIIVRGLPGTERRSLRAQLAEAFAPFEAAGGYEVPGVALCAVAM